jgi:hypothetical protein
MCFITLFLLLIITDLLRQSSFSLKAQLSFLPKCTAEPKVLVHRCVKTDNHCEWLMMMNEVHHSLPIISTTSFENCLQLTCIALTKRLCVRGENRSDDFGPQC